MRGKKNPRHNRRPRLLQVTPNYPPAQHMGGSQEIMSTIASELARVADVRVVTTTFPGFHLSGLETGPLAPGTTLRDDDVEVIRLRCPPVLPFQFGLTPRGVLDLHASIRWADAIHMSELRTVLNLATCSIASTTKGTPIGLSPWGSAGRRRGGKAVFVPIWDRSVGLAICRRVTVGFAQTSQEEGDIAALPGFQAPIEIIPLSIPEKVLEEGRKTPPRSEHGCKALTVARLTPLKGLEVLVRAMADLKLLPITLDLVGDDYGSEASLRKMIDREGLREHVHLRGSFFGQQLYDAYAQADLFVLAPSYWEGTSLASLEAAAFGAVPIISPQVDLPFLQTGSHGWRVDATVGSVRVALREAIRAKESGQLEVMSANAKRMVGQHHSLKRNATSYLNALLGHEEH